MPATENDPITERSMANWCDGPVLIARERCPFCGGRAKVPTPAFAAWSAQVDQGEQDRHARYEVGASTGTAMRDQFSREARDEAGPVPDPTYAACHHCGGRGFKDTEVLPSALRKWLDLPKPDKQNAPSETVEIHMHLDGKEMGRSVHRAMRRGVALV